MFNWRRVKTNDAAKLQDEYARLVEGLQESISDNDNDTDGFMGNPCTSNVTFYRLIWWFQYYPMISWTRQSQEIFEKQSTL